MKCCAAQNLDDGAPSGSSSPAARVVSVEYRFDQQGTIVLANGTQAITDTEGRSINVTVANVANAATFRFLSGTGLQWILNAANTTYISSTLTAPSLEWLMGDIFTAYDVDSSYDLYVRIRATVLTFPTAQVTTGLTLAIRGANASPSNAAARMRGLIRGNHVNVQVMDNLTDTAAGQNYTTAPVTTVDTFGLQSHVGAVDALAGTWAGSWDDTPMTLEVAAQTAASVNTSGYRNALNFLGLAVGSGNANADVQVTIERMRLDFRAAA